MSFTQGVRLGPYEVVAMLGAGGMGEVYKARDMRLGRLVALKVLRADLARDASLRERFEREARTVSSLNHQRICTLYDVGRHDDREFLVMEFLEGQTLADRLERGPLPLGVALGHAIEIAEGLDHAHRRGITHRDLKPANVMLTRSGAKLLDFGLAKLRDDAAEATRALDSGVARFERHEREGTPASSASTMHGPLTETGVVLGTFGYMAPEQIEGHEADERTDIFAFGAVLYEAVTGRRPFEARTRAGMIGAVLASDPVPIGEQRADVPPALDRIVRRCLAKDREERWQTARDLLVALRWVAEGTLQITEANKERARRTRLAAALFVLTVATGLLSWNALRTPRSDEADAARADHAIPAGHTLAAELAPSIAVSPDGSRVVVRMQSGGVPRLYVKRMDQFEFRLIDGSEGAYSPFFSPDGRQVGFMANSQIFRADVDGGPAVPITRAPSLSPGSPGVSWGPDGAIVFAAGQSGLMRVSDRGGVPEPLTTPDAERGEAAHSDPQFLPDRKTLLFTIKTTEGEWRVALLSLDTRRWEWLPSIGQVAGARYVGTGHVVYSQAGSLSAIRFDVSALRFVGSPQPLSEPVYSQAVGDAIVAQFAVSDTGLLAYVSGRPPDWHLVAVDTDGETRLLVDAPRVYRYPRFSPDGRQVAVTVEGERTAINIVDVARGSMRQLTDTGSDTQPTWTSDSQRLTFASRRRGSNGWDIYEMPVDESAGAEQLVTAPFGQYPTSWSRAGVLAFYELNNITARDIWLWSRADRRGRVVLNSDANERGARISPDGRWLAYVSDASGRDEIYVQRHPGPGGREVVSSAGGTEPAWSPGGDELFYRTGNQIVAVRLREGKAVGAPRTVFAGPYVASPQSTGLPNYDVAPDGRTFVMVRSEGAAEMRLRTVQNWFTELRRQTAGQP